MKWRLALILILSATPLAWSDPAKRLVMVGDSLTEGYGVAREQAFPALVETQLKALGKNWQVINAGVSGSTSASALSRVQWQLQRKPDLLFLALGANDGLRGLKTQEMEHNLDKAISACQKAGVKIMLAGMQMPPNYGEAYTKAFAAVFPRLAKKHHIPLLPFLLEPVAGQPELNQADGIHPNEKGHARIADLVVKALQPLL